MSLIDGKEEEIQEIYALSNTKDRPVDACLEEVILKLPESKYVHLVVSDDQRQLMQKEVEDLAYHVAERRGVDVNTIFSQCDLGDPFDEMIFNNLKEEIESEE